MRPPANSAHGQPKVEFAKMSQLGMNEISCGVSHFTPQRRVLKLYQQKEHETEYSIGRLEAVRDAAQCLFSVKSKTLIVLQS
jgi:hypothetical protein